MKDIRLVEGAQRRATKLDSGMENLHYDDRIKRLCVMRLDTRRVRSDLIETLDGCFIWYTVTPEILFEFDDAGRRGHSKKTTGI